MASALPGKYDFDAYRGDTKEWTVEFANDATPPAPIDMSAWTWAAQIRETLDEPASTLATITVDSTSAASGTLTLTLSATEAAKLVTVDGRARYFWDLQGTDGAVVKTWLAGKVNVSGDVTVTA